MAKKPWVFVFAFFLVVGTAGMALGNRPITMAQVAV